MSIPRRPYKGGVKLSVIGFGGIVVCGMEQKDANAIVAEAVDRGVNYFDVAPSYFKGEAEEKLGAALEPFRSQAFLACKTTRRDAKGAQDELEQSLKRLRTDHFDLYQFHGITKMEDVDAIFKPGGAAETFVKAREQGRTRFIGFSAHSVQAAVAMMDRFPFDSVLFPINFVCYAQGNFGPQVVQKAKEKGVARLALKAFAHTPWPEGAEKKYRKCWYQPVDDPALARQALRFALSEDITAAIPPGEERIFRLALDLAADFKPLTAAEREQLLASTKDLRPIFRT
ncbi:MAG: aldo/keto reductase [Planctomycetes bacterium]|nr:aldo/keto reductase [Planctomycetota bacterium]